MADAIRGWFLTLYALGVLAILVRVLPLGLRRASIERRAEGRERWLPRLMIPFNFGVPLLALWLRLGELRLEWRPLRLVGVLLSGYAAVMLLSASATLGRFLRPEAVVLADHELVTRGPYRLVRHPIYSANLALWLGAALGTLNGLLLATWPILLAGNRLEVAIEERLLAARFGEVWQRYAARTGRLLPRLWGGR